MKVRIIKTKGDKICEDITVNCDKSDYEVLYRVWVRSDDVLIRVWTPHEYLTLNPKEKITLSTKIDGNVIDVVAHCLEFRNVYAHKNGMRVGSFIDTVDYSKQT